MRIEMTRDILDLINEILKYYDICIRYDKNEQVALNEAFILLKELLIISSDIPISLKDFDRIIAYKDHLKLLKRMNKVDDEYLSNFVWKVI